MIKLLFALTTLSLIVIAANLTFRSARSTFASIPDATGVIHACYSNLGSPQGSLRVIDTASKFPLGSATCKPGETPISWNATGVPNLVMRTADSTAPVTAVNSAIANCNPREKALGGGYSASIGGAGAEPVVYESRPIPGTPDSSPTGWTASVHNAGNQSTGTVSITVYVICAAPQ